MLEEAEVGAKALAAEWEEEGLAVDRVVAHELVGEKVAADLESREGSVVVKKARPPRRPGRHERIEMDSNSSTHSRGRKVRKLDPKHPYTIC